MAYTITSESYGRRLPKITATADSTDDLAALGTNWAEGSTCLIGETTYSLDKVSGWIIPGSGGGGGGEFIIHYNPDNAEDPVTESYEDILAAVEAGKTLVVHRDNSAGSVVYNTSWQYWPESPSTIVQIHAHELIPGSEADSYWITFNGVNISLPGGGESVTATSFGLFFAAEAD